jgi:ribonuclease G
MQLAIPGRYLVYSPMGSGIGISRRLEDRERQRLRREIGKVDVPAGGVILRTAAQGAAQIDFQRELLYLEKLNEVLQGRAEKAKAPSLIFQEADLAVRVVRDVFANEFERAIVDDRLQYERLVSFLNRTAPDLVERVELYQDTEYGLLDRYQVNEEIRRAMSKRVDLPSGGYLIFDYGEALTVIDVNTGSFTGGGSSTRLEDTITKINLEAAEEIVHQLRLRDIGGIIVIDFIDMAHARNRNAVLRKLRRALDDDRTKTFVVEVSPLGLVEMTRQNVTDGIREIMTRPCSVCNGEGMVISEETVALEFRGRLLEIAGQRPEPEALLVQVNSRVAGR